MAFKDLTRKLKARQAQGAAEARQKEEIRADERRLDEGGEKPPPPKHGPNWHREIGELYGHPVQHDSGWSMRLYPATQQKRLLDERRRQTSQTAAQVDHLAGHPAVSIDKTGRERPVTITETRLVQYDMDQNETIICRIEERR